MDTVAGLSARAAKQVTLPIRALSPHFRKHY
jgi:hypothetical protein